MPSDTISGDEIVAGVLEHALPFLAVTQALWQYLSALFLEMLEETERHAVEQMLRRPVSYDAQAAIADARAEIRERDTKLFADVERAHRMPGGLFFTPAARRKKEAIKSATAAYQKWSGAERQAFLDEKTTRANSAKRRAEKRMREFDARDETKKARDIIREMPGVVRMTRGMKELKPDEEMFNALVSKRSDGRKLLNVDAGFKVVRRRVAIAAAQAGAAAVTGGSNELPAPAPTPSEAPAPEGGRGEYGSALKR